MFKVRLTDILNNIEAIQVLGNPEDVLIQKISVNSQDVEENTCFIAITGFRVDAHKFIPEVIARKVPAIVIEKNDFPDEIFTRNNVVKILVKDTRKALAEISNAFYGFPSRKLVLTGITGTKGKTTTTYLLKSIYETANIKSGLIGTIKNHTGKSEKKAKLTTPESLELNEMFASMLNEGITHCVMEVSSHSLSLKRVHGLDFDFAGFTNLASDHLDFYKTREKYFDAKKILFDELKKNAFAIVNADDEFSEKIVANTKAKVVTFGKKNSSDFQIENIEFDLSGTRFGLIFKGEKVNLETNLIGEFNAYNATLAFIVAYLQNIPVPVIVRGIKEASRVPGRFEVIEGNGKIVIIDYSHTAGSLEQALISLKKIVAGKKKIFTVFGAGGDRDKTKRPEMGKVAEKYSDKVFVTSDNPRTEDPEKIIQDILAGMNKNSVYVNPDREESIKTALSEADEKTVVLIAGKGHEDYQEINGIRKHFSDKEIAEKYLNE